MAASDPTMDVPTPTGTLQGVAAFSWDGSVWQPPGRAGPSVATPTGVLRGVAAFNGGPAWQPAGRAQPGVATPSGVLDGVAVYTWSGSAWTPPGGIATPSTSSGALRGVAAFNWDGAAWQPAGQAGPSVATPYGVLEGVAMFNWTGSAWAATGAPSLGLDFMSGTLDPRITFARASAATYFNSSGTMQTAATNVARFDYDPATLTLRGLLIEEARTNLLLNSAALGTQGVAVTAQSYTLSFYGSGTITMSGAFAGSLVGTGAFPARVQTTFTPAAGTLTCTVTGSVLNAQLEAGGFATSYITTAGAAATRAADLASMPTAAWFNTTNGTYQIECIPNGSPNTAPSFLSGNAGSPTIGTDGFNQLASVIRGVVAVFSGVGPTFAYGSLNKAAFAYLSGASMGAVNSGVFGPNATPFGTLTGTVVQFGADGIALTNAIDGWIRRVRYWPRVLSNAEMQSVTS